MSKKTIAIILAGGIGERMKKSIPKQFVNLSEKPVILHTLEHFERSELISGIIVVCHEDFIKDMERLLKKYKIKKILRVIPGGKTRQESSFIGVRVSPKDSEFILIHDAVRPFITEEIIESVLKAAEEAGSSSVAISATDTIITEKDGFIEKVPERGSLRRMQTPQAFRYEIILKAHQKALEKGSNDATDDCSIVQAIGEKVRLVAGSESNIKLTDQTDLLLAERFLRLKKKVRR